MFKHGDSCSFRRSDGSICNGIIDSIKKDSVIVKFTSRHDHRKFGLKEIHFTSLIVETKGEDDYSFINYQSVSEYCIKSNAKNIEMNQSFTPIFHSMPTTVDIEEKSVRMADKILNQIVPSNTSYFNHFMWIFFFLFTIMFGCIFYLVYDHYNYLKAVSIEYLTLFKK
jgi:hypothetical protein